MKTKKELGVQIGGEIRDARARAGLTQEQLGGLLWLDTKNVSDIERGVVGVTTATLKRICERLAIPCDWLLFGNPEIDDAEYLVRRLERLPPAQFSAVETFFNQTLALFDRSDE